MALIHDFPEALVGGLNPGAAHEEAEADPRSAAMKKILLVLPPERRKEYWAIWLEFTHGESEEAPLVRQVDKLNMAVQASEYSPDPASDLTTEEFMKTARASLTDYHSSSSS